LDHWLNAAASAAKGDFAAAVKWQTQALEQTLTVDSDKKPADLRSRLELYQAAKPYREPTTGR
jgi:hypothetical protein